ncbi:MAG TPA: hypothetical protein VFN09_12270 [Rhodanobacteraceae bacterium]|nr:hypothetical protein [Rhodanobacteraceae bacterium]
MKASKTTKPATTARKPSRPKAPAEVHKTAHQLELERRAEQDRRELEREQAAAHFLAVLDQHRQQARQGPAWPGSATHAGRLAAIGGNEFHDHEAPAAGRRVQQAKQRGKR